MIKTKAVLFLLLLNLSFSVHSQEKDAGFWSEFSLTKKINPRLQCSLTEGFRLSENWSHFSTHYTQPGVQYKFTKNLSLAFAYRFGQRFTIDERIRIRNRFQLDLSYELKLKQLKIAFQERFQVQYTDLYRSENGTIPQPYFRSKITLKYDFGKRLTPFCSSELFFNGSTKLVDNLRTRLGFEYEISKYQSVNLYYMLNQELQVANPLGSYVLGFAYKFTI